jgi:peptidoglycan/LPS O-acetylase OafA/YrhL
MGFRYDIGILRAIAVIAVVLFHFQTPYFQGGFIGVDIFFVISGYLMTANILKGFQNGSFSFKSFYSKRVQRIVPALLFMLVVVVIVSYFTLLPKDITILNQYALSSLLFISNISYYLKSGYFDDASFTNFLLHTWSLSVEWQFYILYPLILFPFRHKIKTNRLVLIVFFAFSIVISFLLMKFYEKKDVSMAFYLLPTRAWEMLIGGLIVFFEKDVKWTGFARKLMCILGVVTLCVCIYMLNEKNITWPSYYTLLPVFATALIIITNAEFRLFKTQFLQFFGNISYSLYLWHWPLFVFTYYFAITHFLTPVFLLLLSISFACLSYYLIEKNKKLTSLKFVLTSSFVGILLFVALNHHKSNFDDSEIHFLSHYNQTYRDKYLNLQFRKGTCHIDIDNTFEQYDQKGCLFINKTQKNILLIGDSHAGALAYSFAEKLNEKNITFLQATVSTTYPLLDTKGPKNSVRLIDFVYNDFLPENAQHIDKVYITAFWGSGQYDASTLKTKIQDLISYLDNNKINYTIIGQTPAYTMGYPEILALEMKTNSSLEQRYILTQAVTYNSFLSKELKSNTYLDISKFHFIKYINRKSYMYDDDHLSIFGADQLVNYILHQN